MERQGGHVWVDVDVYCGTLQADEARRERQKSGGKRTQLNRHGLLAANWNQNEANERQGKVGDGRQAGGKTGGGGGTWT